MRTRQESAMRRSIADRTLTAGAPGPAVPRGQQILAPSGDELGANGIVLIYRSVIAHDRSVRGLRDHLVETQLLAQNAGKLSLGGCLWPPLPQILGGFVRHALRQLCRCPDGN